MVPDPSPTTAARPGSSREVWRWFGGGTGVTLAARLTGDAAESPWHRRSLRTRSAGGAARADGRQRCGESNDALARSAVVVPAERQWTRRRVAHRRRRRRGRPWWSSVVRRSCARRWRGSLRRRGGRRRVAMEAASCERRAS